MKDSGPRAFFYEKKLAIGNSDPQKLKNVSIRVAVYVRVLKVGQKKIGMGWIPLEALADSLCIKDEIKLEFDNRDLYIRYEVQAGNILNESVNLEVWKLEKIYPRLNFEGVEEKK